MPAAIHVLDPLIDSRWDDLLERHPRASVYHSRGWLDALKRTYGYEPIALTTTAEGPLENGLALCRVRTWASRRLVSLPFSDHCDPLVDRPEDLSCMLAQLVNELGKGRWRSLELRPRQEVWHAGAERPFGVAEGASYCLHTLDLSRPAEQVFKGFHASSTQRAIRRAEREGLTCESGRSEGLLSSFYRLLRLTRRRHRLPPQPFAWFKSLAASLGDTLTIWVASKENVAVAAILALTFKKTMVYKYGGSDAAYHALGSMPFLFWRAVRDAQARGIEEFDLGRSDLDQPGLIAFKDHLGASRTTLTYYTRPERRPAPSHAGPLARLARKVVPLLPDAALDFTGRVLYRHLG